MRLSQTQSVPWNAKLATNNQAKYEFELSNMSVKGFTVQKIARMKNGINRYEKVRIDLGWKPKECLQSYKEFCQSLDIFGVVHVHVCAQHRRAGVSAAVNFFGASTRLRRVSAPKKLTAASTPALLCFAHTCTYISYTKNVS